MSRFTQEPCTTNTNTNTSTNTSTSVLLGYGSWSHSLQPMHGFGSSTSNQPSLTGTKALTSSPPLSPQCLHCLSLNSHTHGLLALLDAQTATLHACLTHFTLLGFDLCLFLQPRGSSMPYVLFTSPVSALLHGLFLVFCCCSPSPLFFPSFFTRLYTGLNNL